MNTSSSSSSSNRRRAERLYQALPATVRATNAQGQRVKITTTLDNLSPGGMFLRLPVWFDLGSALFTLIRLPSSAGLAAVGRVVRREPPDPTGYGVAIQFHQTRLLALPG